MKKFAISLLICTLVVFLGACNPMNEKRQPLPSYWQELFENPEKLSEKSRSKPLSLSKALIRDYDIHDAKVVDAIFEDTEWKNVSGVRSQFTKVVFKNSDMVEVDFSSSKMNDVMFENVNFSEVRFNKSQLNDVIFKNCTIRDTQVDYFRGFNRLEANKIEFVNSFIENITFFESRGHFYIEKSKLEKVSFSGLKSGSLLNINEGYFSELKLDGSEMILLSAKNSIFIKSSAQDAQIGKVELVSSDLDISFARSAMAEVNISDTKNELLGFVESEVGNISIKFCKFGGNIPMPDLKFKSIQINNCNDIDLTLTGATGKELIVSNCVLNKAKFKKVAVEKLIIDNVEFNGETNFDGAQAKASEVNGIRKGPAATVTAKGSNIRFY